MGADFASGLRELGFVVTELGGNRLSFPYTIEVGRFTGRGVHIGLIVDGGFPVSVPTGPHICPQLLPITGGGGEHPHGGVHPSDFGPEWEYWSRPYPGWASSDRTVMAYIRFLRRLFDFP